MTIVEIASGVNGKITGKGDRRHDDAMLAGTKGRTATAAARRAKIDRV